MRLANSGEYKTYKRDNVAIHIDICISDTTFSLFYGKFLSKLHFLCTCNLTIEMAINK